MRVLVTGHNGYIGSVLTPRLVEHGFDIVGLDSNWFRDCTFGPEPNEVPDLAKDYRDLEVHDLKELDAVVHLASLAIDPKGLLDAELTYDINHKATVRLAVLAKQAGVRRFVFLSTCTVYPSHQNVYLTEGAELDPVTAYEECKVRVEGDLRELADDRFSPLSFRCATAYGLSPRLRLDLLLNELVASAVTAGRIRLASDTEAWRPMIHVEDIAGALITALTSPREAIHDRIFNLGLTEENYRIEDLVGMIGEIAPALEIDRSDLVDHPQLSYRVDFSRVERELPGWEPQWNARKGARQLAEALVEHGLDSDERRYRRLDHLRELLSNGRMTADLRWRRRRED